MSRHLLFGHKKPELVPVFQISNECERKFCLISKCMEIIHKCDGLLKRRAPKHLNERRIPSKL